MILLVLILLGIVDLPKIFTKPVQPGTTGHAVEEKATLQIQDHVYEVNFQFGDSVYEAMKRLAQTQEFSFQAKSFSGLGYYIEKINREKEGNGEYWVYYVNNCKPSVGISEYKLKPGDKILWRKEKNNNNQPTCLIN